MYELKTEIRIAATSQRVWEELTNFQSYPDWNPFVTEIKGKAAVGEKLEALLTAPGGKPFAINPTVVSCEPERRFAWLGHLMVRGIFDGEHRFEIVPDGDGVTLVHAERFGGLLVPFLKGMLEGSTRKGFEAMNLALKQRAETARP